jgi:hypothetical protein
MLGSAGMGDWLEAVNSLQQAAETAPLKSIPDLMAELERAKATAYARLLSAPKNERDDLLTAEQVAEWLNVDRRWPYRHADDLQAVRLSEKCLRFPRKGVERYLVRRRA